MFYEFKTTSTLAKISVFLDFIELVQIKRFIIVAFNTRKKVCVQDKESEMITVCSEILYFVRLTFQSIMTLQNKNQQISFDLFTINFILINTFYGMKL